MSVDQLQLLVDELAVRKVLDEYCLRLEVNAFEEWLDLFTQDSVYEVYKKVLTGRDAIRELLSLAPHGVHLGGPMRITLDGDSAETIQNYLFIGEADAAWNMGWYFRTVVRTDLGWKIAHTRVKMVRIGTGKPPLLAVPKAS